jgi:hypothetical protein
VQEAAHLNADQYKILKAAEDGERAIIRLVQRIGRSMTAAPLAREKVVQTRALWEPCRAI